MHDAEYYEKLGFKCGLEIHQRLATKEKLFCACTAMPMKEDKQVATIERRQRAVAGELGSVDISSRFEAERGRKFIYQAFKHSTCLVDIDEEPPHELNREALEISLLIAKALNAEVPDEIEPMRKGVVDGSDPSAFQRTMLIGYDGYIDADGTKIAIPSIFLEEESSGIVSSDSEKVVYDVSRLGIPLVEIDTAPTIKTPQEAKKVAMEIGLLLRLTFKVQRGIGSIRQDVNVSIREGNRVEIKGFQDLASMDKIIENEVERQLKLIEIAKELSSRKAKIHEYKDLTKTFEKTGAKIIRNSLKNNGVVYGFRLEGFKGLLGREVNLGRRLGTEISDYAKLAGVGGIIHSDENLASYGISEEEISNVNMELGLSTNDAFIIIAAEKETCANAIRFAQQRAEQAIHGVPKETRAADSSTLTTKFLRPLPGGSRMYPETDAMPIAVSGELIAEAKKNAPNIDAMKKKLEQEIGNKQLAEQMLWSTKLQSYETIVKESKAKPSLVAAVLLEKMTELRRNGYDVESIDDSVLAYIMSLNAEGKITKVAIEELLKELPKSKNDVDLIIKSKNLSRISGKELKELVSKFGGSKEERIKKIMSEYRARVDGDELLSVLGE